jgi:hypothetical protein
MTIFSTAARYGYHSGDVDPDSKTLGMGLLLKGSIKKGVTPWGRCTTRTLSTRSGYSRGNTLPYGVISVSTEVKL